MAWRRWSAGEVARYGVAADEWVRVEAGFVARADLVAALVVDGVLSLDGVIHV